MCTWLDDSFTAKTTIWGWLTFITHSYSPYFESNVPFCRDRSLRVKRGPSSWIPTFFSFLKMYLSQMIFRDLFSLLNLRFKTDACVSIEGWKIFTCEIWKRWSLAGCGRWRPVCQRSVALVGKELRTDGRWCVPNEWWNCWGSPLGSVRLDFCLVSAGQRKGARWSQMTKLQESVSHCLE